jgi:L-ascorbate metabolism protein UlaG (beta-lactamase superfamily)
MKIYKYNHSCLLIEEDGKRLLIDPGKWSFGDNFFKVADVGAVDVILLTHEHADHTNVEALKDFVRLGEVKIITHDNLALRLEEHDLKVDRIAVGKPQEVAGFRIEAYGADHAQLPVPVPHNLAYVINGRMCHPGDSLRIEGLERIEILALPVGGPWMKINEALQMLSELKPAHSFPIHDASTVEDLRPRLSEMLSLSLKETDSTFHSIGDHGSLEL